MAQAKLRPEMTYFSQPTPWKKAGRRAGGKAASFTLVTESIQHGSILPAGMASPVGGCCTKKSGMKSCQGPPRLGQVDLIFARRPKKKGEPAAGPALRLCTEKGKGIIVPVRDPREAKRIALEFQRCVGDSPKKIKACVSKARGS